jgi:hypothetical protein
MFLRDLPPIGSFLRIIQFPPTIKLTAKHDITEIVLKVALNTINHDHQLDLRICLKIEM